MQINFFLKGIASIFDFSNNLQEKHLKREYLNKIKYLNNLDVYSDFKDDWQAIQSDFASVLKKKQ